MRHDREGLCQSLSFLIHISVYGICNKTSSLPAAWCMSLYLSSSHPPKWINDYCMWWDQTLCGCQVALYKLLQISVCRIVKSHSTCSEEIKSVIIEQADGELFFFSGCISDFPDFNKPASVYHMISIHITWFFWRSAAKW